MILGSFSVGFSKKCSSSATLTSARGAAFDGSGFERAGARIAKDPQRF